MNLKKLILLYSSNKKITIFAFNFDKNIRCAINFIEPIYLSTRIMNNDFRGTELHWTKFFYILCIEIVPNPLGKHCL